MSFKRCLEEVALKTALEEIFKTQTALRDIGISVVIIEIAE